MSVPPPEECYGRPAPGPPDPWWYPYVRAAALPVCGLLTVVCLAALAWIALAIGSIAALVMIGVVSALMAVCAARIAQTRPWSLEAPDVVPKRRTVVYNSEVWESPSP